MINRLKDAKGFTLIELVMVIVILGILAAVAVPKFINLQGSAATSVAHGITGAVQGAFTMAHAKRLISKAYTRTYTISTILNDSIDTSGIDALVPGGGTFTALINGETYQWTFSGNDGTDSSGIDIATIEENTTTGGFKPPA